MKAALIAAILMAPVAALAHDYEKNVDAASYTPEQFIGKLNHKNRMHLDLGSMAQGQAASSKVKMLADRMVKDHTRLDSLLFEYAAEQSVAVADAERAFGQLMETSMTAQGETPRKPWKAEDEEKMDRLRSMTGPQFDRQFLSTIASGSQRMVGFLEQYKASQDDKKVKRLVDKFISTFRSHQREAEKLQGSLPAA